jgi:hypothetical protein
MSTIAQHTSTPIHTDQDLDRVPTIQTNGQPNLSKPKLLAQTTRRRDEANKLLQSLLDAKKVSERNLASINQDDLLKRVTGNSSMDNAIASTRKLIDSFNRVIDDLRRNLSDEDLAAL